MRMPRGELMGMACRRAVVVCVVACSMLIPILGHAEGATSDHQNGVVVRSFDECVKQQGKVLKSYPAQCVDKSGRVFAQPADQSPPKKLCVDRCGDGECQEIVCMAEGCPCAEAHSSCPQDCAE